jgi:hypothetical protein
MMTWYILNVVKKIENFKNINIGSHFVDLILNSTMIQTDLW